jgi:ABC-2 type transport system permease protein
MILVMPLIQLLVLPLAADFEIKNINVSIVDNDHSSYSQKLISKISGSPYFKLTGYSNSFNQSFEEFQQDRADLIIEIPAHLKEDWFAKMSRNCSLR